MRRNENEEKTNERVKEWIQSTSKQNMNDDAAKPPPPPRTLIRPIQEDTEDASVMVSQNLNNFSEEAKENIEKTTVSVQTDFEDEPGDNFSVKSFKDNKSVAVLETNDQGTNTELDMSFELVQDVRPFVHHFFFVENVSQTETEELDEMAFKTAETKIASLSHSDLIDYLKARVEDHAA